ncbi:hypothetical protein DXX99_10935, partial [Ammonifex thiophilus]
TARLLLEEVVQEFEAVAPRAIERLEAGFEDAMAVMALPEPVRKNGGARGGCNPPQFIEGIHGPPRGIAV